MSDKIVMDQWSNKYSQILSDYGLIENNMIFMVTYNDFAINYKGNKRDTVAELFWDNQVFEYTSNKIKSENDSISDIIERMSTTNIEVFKLNAN